MIVDARTVCDALGFNYYMRQVPSLKKVGKEYVGLCPFHDDKHASFSVSPEKQIWFCHTCNIGGDQINFYMEQHGLTHADFVPAVEALAKEAGIYEEPRMNHQGKVVARFDYVDEQGTLLYQVERIEPGRDGRKKDFRQRKPDGNGGWIYKMAGVRRIPYRLPELIASKNVVIVEGEGKADRLRALGFIVTTSVSGAGKWLPEYNEYFKGKRVVILSDNDEPGRKHAQLIASNLKSVVEMVKVVELTGLKEKGDIADWIDAGGTKEQLFDLVKNTSEWIEKKSPAQEESKEITRTRDPHVEAIYGDTCRYWNDIESGKIKFIPACSLFSDDKGPTVEAYVYHHVNFVAGYTSAGKSTLLAQMTVEAARQKAKQTIFSLEDTREEKLMTMIAVMTGIHKRKMVLRKFTPEEHRKISEAAAEILSWNLRIYDNVRTLTGMEAIIKEDNSDIVGIDYVQNIQIPGTKIYDKMAFAAQEIYRFASDYEKSFTVLSQVSNDSVTNGSDLIAMKGAGELAAIANSVLWLSKGRKEENQRRVTLGVKKNKTFGPCRDIELEYSEDWTRLERVLGIPETKSFHEERLNERKLKNEK